MADTASETASSLQLVRTMINPNATNKLPDENLERTTVGRAASPVESEDADLDNFDEMPADIESQAGTDNIGADPYQRSRIEFASDFGTLMRPDDAQSKRTGVSYPAVSSIAPPATQLTASSYRPQIGPPVVRQSAPPKPLGTPSGPTGTGFYEAEQGAYYEPRNRTPPPHPGFSAHPIQEISEADTLRSKHTMLIELHYLKGQGAILTKDYTIHDDLGDVHFELMRQRNLVDCSQTVDQWIVYIIVGVYLIEWLNSVLGSPLYFAGVGEYMSKNMASVKIPLQRCYHRYIHRPSNNPIWDVIKALVVSLVAYHLQMMLVTNIAGASTARNTSVAAPSNIMSMLPIIMSALGGSSGLGGIASMFSGASAARPATAQEAPPATHVPFGGGFGSRDELKMPPPPSNFRR